MTGKFIQDDESRARILYIKGINLVEVKELLTGTEYKFDSIRIYIRVPYKGLI